MNRRLIFGSSAFGVFSVMMVLITILSNRTPTPPPGMVKAHANENYCWQSGPYTARVAKVFNVDGSTFPTQGLMIEDGDAIGGHGTYFAASTMSEKLKVGDQVEIIQIAHKESGGPSQIMRIAHKKL